MNAWKQIGLLLAFALVAGVVSAILHPRRPPWFEVADAAAMRWSISSEKAKSLSIDAEVVWIDARSRANYEADHIPGAILLNPEEWGELLFESQESLQAAFDRPVIVYCDGEACTRSAEVGERLRELMGLSPVYVLKGDWRMLRDEASQR